MEEGDEAREASETAGDGVDFDLLGDKAARGGVEHVIAAVDAEAEGLADAFLRDGLEDFEEAVLELVCLGNRHEVLHQKLKVQAYPMHEIVEVELRHEWLENIDLGHPARCMLTMTSLTCL